MATQELNKKFHWGTIMCFVTAFQVLTSTVIITQNGINLKLLALFVTYIAVEWIYFIIASTFFNQNNFEIEVIGFLFSSIGLVNCGGIYDGYAIKQGFCVLLGLVVFIVMLCFLRRTDVVMFLRMPVAVAAFGLLAANLVLAKYNNGALNWITFKDGFSIQPSEFVKLAFIFVGAASLDKLQSTKSLTKYLIFSFICIGALFLMRDFGTALIFFFTFVVIAFMRSGDVRTIALVCVAAVLGALMIIYFRPTVAARFETYRHIWESVNGKGMQQTRVLIYSASGGLLGLGIGKGKMGSVVYSTTDLVFGMICEEWGMIVAFAIVITYVFLLIYSIKIARTTRSAFYAIACCAASGLMLFQAGLNIFGVTDILPFTGVTLPFISRGGSSIICSWGLLAFIKSADIRTYPKLSKTILPDHPLYPENIRIGKRPAPRRYTPNEVNLYIDNVGTTRKKNTQPKPQVKRTTPPAQKPPVRKTAAQDIPISRGTKSSAQSAASAARKQGAPKRGGDRR